MVQDVEVIGRVKISNHGIGRSRISLDLKQERIKLLKQKTPNLHSIRNKVEEFRLLLENKFAVLPNQDDDVDVTNDYFTNVVIESALATRERQP